MRVRIAAVLLALVSMVSLPATAGNSFTSGFAVGIDGSSIAVSNVTKTLVYRKGTKVIRAKVTCLKTLHGPLTVTIGPLPPVSAKFAAVALSATAGGVTYYAALASAGAVKAVGAVILSGISTTKGSNPALCYAEDTPLVTSVGIAFYH